LAFVTVVYTAFNVALAGMLPANVIAASEKPVVPMAQLLFGDGGSKFITVGMLVSMFGTLNAVIMTSPRYYFAMARDGMFPGAAHIVKLHPRFQTPTTALAVSAAWSAVLLVTGQFGQLLNLVVFVAWLFYVCTMAAVFVLRRTQPDMPRPYRVWGYPVVPAVGIASGLWILGSTLLTDPFTAVLGVGLTLTGVPVYLVLRRKQKAQQAAKQAA
ncbi:MAG TPA: amino acid permease, partial [Symbiobacteriaceae bacterium]|nr:amino acid permease [Symbiobacteriaceae bacterium]